MVASEIEGKRVIESRENDIEMRDIEISKLKRVLKDKEEEIESSKQRFEAKQITRQQRSDT